MGQEIETTTFTDADRRAFGDRLRGETELLRRWFEEERFVQVEKPTFGLEIEGWLLDRDFMPTPRNEDFLKAAADPLLVEELAQFNFEMNTSVRTLSGRMFHDLEREVRKTWARCRMAGRQTGAYPALFGILPTVRDDMLQPEYISDRNRYRALTEQVLRQRGDAPLRIAIDGRETFELECRHIMLEAACTSIQTHLQVNQADAVRFMNASMIVSAPVVAAAANSPFLYGRALWDETRIPTFERAVRACPDDAGPDAERVSFGSGYVSASMFELFEQNVERFPALLPILFDTPPEKLAHLRLHNGTLWRWNRPIIGFDQEGHPHVRIEHRVMPAGPTIMDIVANAAFYVGLVVHYARADTPPEDLTPFAAARANFYAAAKDGLRADVAWMGETHALQRLILDRLIPEACDGLARIGVDEADVQRFLTGVMHRRMMTGRTGAEWQRSFIDVHGVNFQALTEAYIENQMSGEPVHEWIV